MKKHYRSEGDFTCPLLSLSPSRGHPLPQAPWWPRALRLVLVGATGPSRDERRREGQERGKRAGADDGRVAQRQCAYRLALAHTIERVEAVVGREAGNSGVIRWSRGRAGERDEARVNQWSLVRPRQSRQCHSYQSLVIVWSPKKSKECKKHKFHSQSNYE